MSESGIEFRPCACMGPQATDPYCPCAMQRMKMDGFYNCYGDQDALAKREQEAHDRLRKAMTDWNRRHSGDV